MVEIVLHIGAHRTGTTSVQRYLKKNQVYLLECGIQTIFPPTTRDEKIRLSSCVYPRVLISEENMLGTMENNIQNGSLYLNATTQLARYSSILEHVKIIYLSIRNIVDWWSSSISYITKSCGVFPNKLQLEKIANSNRSWSEVINDIQSTAPNADIVIREFSWKTDNPKQQLRQVVKWNEWNETIAEKSLNNIRPTVSAMAAALIKKGEMGNLYRLPRSQLFSPFAKEKMNELDEAYIRDLHIIKDNSKVRLLVDFNAVKQEIAIRNEETNNATKNGEPIINKTCLLHIGKTGGTYVKSLLNTLDESIGELYVGNHSDTLLTTMSKFGRGRKVGFFFRNPKERFVSGFNSRLRQGRPTYNSNWSEGEAISFSYFANPNSLAEALFSNDERQKSAARFAFSRIFHLKNGYTHYLHSSEVLIREKELGNIVVCCETSKIDANFEKIFQSLGSSIPKTRIGDRHESQDSDGQRLSDLAITNLEKYWETEFSIYKTCQLIARELGFSIRIKTQ